MTARDLEGTKQRLLDRYRDVLTDIPTHGDMPGAIYLRISEDREGDELGIDRHFEDLLMLFKARRFALDREHIFIDNDLSAAGKKNRPGFVDLLRAIEGGKLRVVAAWMLDRFLRNRQDQLWLYESAEKAGIMMSFARGADIDMSTPAGQMVADFLAAGARGEIKVKGDRQRRAQLQAAKQGRRVGGRKPFGYAQDGMTLIPAEAAAIKRAYDDLLVGAPLAEIARQWNTAGLFSGQSRWSEAHRGEPARWKHDTVRLVLLNPRNAGLRRYRGEIIGRAVWPAIVEEDTWRAAVDLLRDPSRYSGARADQQLLTGVAACGVNGCGLTVHGGGASHKKPVYRCRSLRHVNRLADPVDRYVGDLVIERLSRPDAAELLIDRKRPDMALLQAEAVALRQRMASLDNDLDDGLIAKARWLERNQRMTAKLAELEAKMADAGRVDVLGPLVNADDVAAVWESMDRGRQRAVIDALVSVRLYPVGRGTRTFRSETVRITWRSPD